MTHSSHLVVGLGKTGLSIARYLRRKNQSFAVFDTRNEVPGMEEFKSEFPDVPLYLEALPTELLNQLTDIIASPGVSLETAFFEQAKKQGVAIYGDIECLARDIQAPMIAITGTNGKSTVTTLVGEIAKAAGFRVAVAGNIGAPVLDLADDGHQYDLWVLELSSFQLDLTHSLSPIAATILNITPDHLDRHHTLQAYVDAKQRVYSKAKLALYNREDEATQPGLFCAAECKRVSFGQNNPNIGDWGLLNDDGITYLAKGNDRIMPVDALRIKGVHNWLNALAACALSEAAGIPRQHSVEVLKTFKGLPHRCQWVRSLDQVEWINDSKGTNVGATISAINGVGGAMQGKIVLIAGGQGKGADFKELIQPLADHVRSMILIGQDADIMEASLRHVIPTVRAPSLEMAVSMAKVEAKPGDVVLLSPACASLDMFRDFNHRGEVFTATVTGL